jgi:hypothetical protein
VGVGTPSPQSSIHSTGAIQVGTTTDACTPARAGAIRFTNGAFQGCNGNVWADFKGFGLGGSSTNAATDCLQIKAENAGADSGFYWLDPDPQAGPQAALEYCDMATDGGGWTRVAENHPILGTSWNSTQLNTQGFRYGEVLIRYRSGTVTAGSVYPSTLPGPVAIYNPTRNVWLNGGNAGSACSTPVDNYFSTTPFGADFKANLLGPSDVNTFLQVGTLEGVAQCALQDNSGTAFVDVFVRRRTNAVTSAQALASCEAHRAAGNLFGDGYYWLDTDAGGPQAAHLGWCDMTRDGGGWTRVAASHPVHGTTWSSTSYNTLGYSYTRVRVEYLSGNVVAGAAYPASIPGPVAIKLSNVTAWYFVSGSGSNCSLSVQAYPTPTVSGTRFWVDFGSATTAQIQAGTVEGVANCTTSDNSGTAQVALWVR